MGKRGGGGGHSEPQEQRELNRSRMPDREPHEVFHYPASPAKIFSSASSLSPPVGGSAGRWGGLVTKVLREGNSPASDKEKSWASYQGAVRFPGHGRLIEFVIGGRPPSTRGRWEMRKLWSTTKGGRWREAGAGEGGRRTVTGPGSRVASLGSPHGRESQGRSPLRLRSWTTRGAGSDVSEG